ncbi:hypothetical protein VNO77_41968 [Canavalia gladiata]|uniref:Uncharacterized protein n=1 Tax=Canavalia gladiata TaxID=3824 RepID=A0AAN9K1M3_CANGL
MRRFSLLSPETLTTAKAEHQDCPKKLCAIPHNIKLSYLTMKNFQRISPLVDGICHKIVDYGNVSSNIMKSAEALHWKWSWTGTKIPLVPGGRLVDTAREVVGSLIQLRKVHRFLNAFGYPFSMNRLTANLGCTTQDE